jgi:hypothetical protein
VPKTAVESGAGEEIIGLSEKDKAELLQDIWEEKMRLLQQVAALPEGEAIFPNPDIDEELQKVRGCL